MNKKIHIFEPVSETLGAEVTIASHQGRKTFHLKRPLPPNEQPPLAIESFAIDPDYYAELMQRVETLHRPRNEP
ncbi:MAG: hypothetical protein P8P49_06155 [Opitutales bacterium]|nr:hypothetical protein [Opitutales bacterium]MDG1325331.1 hypothetical protein [Opitutales bacterium]